jgi:hypothetical protein
MFGGDFNSGIDKRRCHLSDLIMGEHNGAAKGFANRAMPGLQ